ncbi:endonuclease/exonuclease/phosphatase family protein [Kiloniella laminariae]|uniref:Endonuclease/exonuclease/phosphatase family protein n=1 Tax=Kiloniella laminariae TaxID=454162 RepID=A0ABT4LHS5_9PROT|nr:endonuclease/exonuclease/phosphatase family protein [Kiloniella laminariae]MCZ4280644.1 endonuclease/exonuclease/phosphatase family protein [Kiloniella laminariae]
MTDFITWNIQCGRGTDNKVDLPRIADVIKGMSDADVICLQEVARFDPELDNGRGEDQVEVLAQLFPEHSPVFGPAISRKLANTNKRSEFGNLILSRRPLLQVFRHQLPQPNPEILCKHMPRQALEVVVSLPDGPLSVTTTHLEYHSALQRQAQAARLIEIQQENNSNRNYADHAPASGPYAAVPRPERSLLCGDFNSAPGDQVYNILVPPEDQKTHRQQIQHSGGYLDCWTRLRPKEPHSATCGIYDQVQWPEGPHCRDFFFVSSELVDLLEQITVQEETSASDHQPLLLRLKHTAC